MRSRFQVSIGQRLRRVFEVLMRGSILQVQYCTVLYGNEDRNWNLALGAKGILSVDLIDGKCPRPWAQGVQLPQRPLRSLLERLLRPRALHVCRRRGCAAPPPLLLLLLCEEPGGNCCREDTSGHRAFHDAVRAKACERPQSWAVEQSFRRFNLRRRRRCCCCCRRKQLWRNHLSHKRHSIEREGHDPRPNALDGNLGLTLVLRV